MGQPLIDTYSKEQLIDIVLESHSLREVILKLGYKSTSGNSRKTIEKRLEEYGISTTHFNKFKPKGQKRTPQNIFIENSTATQSTLRRYYERGNYSEYKCAICGLKPFWNGKELTLTLDHINGINNDDRLENLRWVCPNCNRQLPTFAGKGTVKSGKHKKKTAQPTKTSKAVHMINAKTNEIEKTFDSIAEATRFLNIEGSDSHISDVCNQNRKTAYGYKWRFVENNNRPS